MRNIHFILEDEEAEELDRVRKDLTWREFVLQFIEPKKKVRL